MKACVEQTFDGATAPYSGYDYTKITLGPLIFQYNDNTGAATDHYCGPMKMGFVRVMEQAAQTVGGVYPSVVPFSDILDWVFLSDYSAAAATRRVFLFTFNKTTSSFAYIGNIFMTLPSEGSTVFVQAFRASMQLYTAGTIYGLSGTNTITGYQTGWSGKNLPAGTRIGFGSSVQSSVSGWYKVSGYTGTGDTTLTLKSNLSTTYASGTPYVIEDLRLLNLCVGTGTATKGGLYMTKGVAYDDFATGVGTPISGTYSATDGAAGVYWYMDAAVGTYVNTANYGPVGIGMEPMIDWNTQNIYCLHAATPTTLNIRKYNIRANLTMGFSGKTTAPYPVITGTTAAVTGNISNYNNGRYAVLNHGACSGVPSIFFVTSSKIYRVPTSYVTAGNTLLFGDNPAGWSELPTGTTAAYALGGAFTSVEHSDTLDRLYVMSTGGAGIRSYVTRYDPAIGAYDHIFLIDTKQQDQLITQATAPNLPQIPSITAGVFSIWTSGGIVYLCKTSTVVASNQMYAVPTSVDWNYTYKTHSVLMTPQISTPGAKKFYRVYVNFMRDIGVTPYCYPTEPFRLSYRTTGITDNMGVWHAVDETGDLTGISASSTIQFQFEFQAIGTFELMPRIYSLSVVYEDSGNDSHYTPSVSNTVVASRIFAFRQQATWGGTIPALTITITNAVTGGPVLTDTTTDHVYGLWQYSTDATNWNTWSTGADAVGNYIRYSGTTLPDGITAKAIVSL